MQRRTLLAAPVAAPLAAPLISPMAAPLVAAALAGAAEPAAAQGAPQGTESQDAVPSLASDEYFVPARDAGIELYVRNKRPEGLAARPDRTVLFVHGATYPAETAFDLPLGDISWMDYIAARGFDVWCMDVRGYGRSTRPPEMARPAAENPPLVRGETAVADIAAVADFIRERRGLPRLVVMGWSWGTALMGRYAADNPSLVERVVLYAPVWLRNTPSLVQAGPGPLGAYRTVTRQQARERWLAGVPEEKKAALIPAGWFDYWANLTFATDPEGQRLRPPVLRAPNGVVLDGQEYWSAGRPFYDPAKITAPTLLVLAEWDRDTPLYMATTLFPLLTNAPGKRLVVLAEGTHSILMERNRGALFQAVQVFLEEAPAG
ncbi:alpha/beta hydrolase [Roseomonas sp. NAR14]|uniref:Alpha/beta hydrolase n=1 Tax=Roseomonas acroporae TaxID=2937791 RepID=A0A9X2BUD4_9PROT|nr:alpha/beta fold hydrolase [Roseomonas acroporae]MCK8783941.1 alpha/beta hydrolase [Roseomonas acroporae]